MLYDLDKNCPLTVWETHQINEEAQPPSPSKKGAQQDINPPPNYAAILVSKNDAELGTFGIEHVVIPLAGWFLVEEGEGGAVRPLRRKSLC